MAKTDAWLPGDEDAWRMIGELETQEEEGEPPAPAPEEERWQSRMERERSQPYWFTILEDVRGTALSMQVSIRRVLVCIPCTPLDIDALCNEYLYPLQAKGLYCYLQIFEREPDNPIRRAGQQYLKDGRTRREEGG